MTQPDQDMPDASWNASSLAELAAKTQEEWEADQAAGIGNPLTDLLNGLIGDLPNIPAVSFVNRLLTGLVRKLTGDVTAVFSTVSDALDALLEIPILGPLIEAVTGILGGTVDDLQAWLESLGSDVTDVVAAIAALIAGVSGSTIADVVAAIGDALSDASTALAAIAALISGVGGTVIADVVTALSGAVSDASSALTQLAALISGVSGTTISDVVAALTGAVSDASTALTRIASLIAGVSGTTITDVVNAINDGVTALTRIASLISGVSGSTISDVVTAINSGVTALARIASLISGVSGSTISDVVTAVNNGVTALTRIASLISGVGGTTITDVITAVNNGVTALTRIATLISGVGGTTITDVVTFITGLNTAFNNLYNAVYNAFHNAAATGKTLTDISNSIAGFITGLYNQITGASATAASSTDVTAALDSHVISTGGTAATTTIVETVVKGIVNGGTTLTHNFSEDADAAHVPSDFTFLITIPVGTAGPDPFSTSKGRLIGDGYIICNTATQGDNQLVSATWSIGSSTFAAPPPSYGGGSGSFGSTISDAGLFARANSGASECVFAKYHNGVWGINIYGASGSTHANLATLSANLLTNASYGLIAGTDGNPYLYRLTCNGIVILQYDDSGTLYSSVDSSHRLCGAYQVGNQMLSFTYHDTSFITGSTPNDVSLVGFGSGINTITLDDATDYRALQGFRIPADKGLRLPATSSFRLVSAFDSSTQISGKNLPQSALQPSYVATSEATASATYTDLATLAPVTVTPGPLGYVAVYLSHVMSGATVDPSAILMSFTMSGGNIQAADDSYSVGANNRQAGGGTGNVFIVPAPNQSPTVFTPKFRVTAGTMNTSQRRLTVIPL